MEKEVSPVDRRGVVRYVHRTCGSSSTHLSFASSNLFFQRIDYDLINSLGLSISLGVGRSIISVCNSQATIVSFEGLTNKLKVVIRDEGMRDPKSSNDVLLDKFLSIHILDVGQGLGFDPFCEIVYANQ